MLFTRKSIICCVLLCGISFINLSPAIAENVASEATALTPLEQSQQTALTFTDALNRQDFDQLNTMIDVDTLGLTVAQSVLNKQSDIDDFMSGFASSANKRQIGQNLFSAVVRQDFRAKYLRIVDEDGVKRPLIRIDYGSGGMEYMILHLTAEQKMEDAYLASSGKLLSQTLIQATSLMIAPDPSFFGKMFKSLKVDQQILDDFQLLAKYRQNGDFQKAYDVVKGMPPEVQNQRIIIDIAIVLAQSFSDKEYAVQLKQLATHYGDDPSTQFMLVDYHVLREDFPSTITALRNVQDRFGVDGPLSDLLTNMYYVSGDLERAVASANIGIAAEPDYEATYWSLLGIYLENNRFADIAETLTVIETQLGYEFTQESMSGEPSFGAFLGSDAFQQWNAAK